MNGKITKKFKRKIILIKNNKMKKEEQDEINVDFEDNKKFREKC